MPASFKFSSDTQGMVAPVQKASAEIRAMQKELYAARQASQDSFRAQALEAKAAGASSEELRKLQQKQFGELLAIQNAHKQLSSTYVSGGREKVSAEEATKRATDSVTESLKQQRAEVERLVAANKQGAAVEHVGATRQQQASAILRGGGLRAGEAFAATLPGFDKLANIAFPIAGVAALGREAYHAVEAFIQMREEAQHTAESIREGFEGLISPIQLNTDELRKANAELDISIAKFQHKPANTLALAAAEARIEFDKLAQSADKAFLEVTKVIEANKNGLYSQLVMGKDDTGVVSAEVKQQMKGLRDLSRSLRDGGHNGASADQLNAIKGQIATKEAALLSFANREIATRTGSEGMADVDARTGRVTNQRSVSYADMHGPQEENLAILDNVKQYVYAQQDFRSESQSNQEKQGQLKQLESAKALASAGASAARKAIEAQRKAAADQRKQWEEQHKVAERDGTLSAEDDRQFWLKRAAAVKSGSENYVFAEEKANDDLRKVNDERKKALEEQIKMREQFALVQHKEIVGLIAPGAQRNAQGVLDQQKTLQDLMQSQEAAKFAAAQANVQYQLQAGLISKADAAVQLQTLHTIEYEAAVKRLREQYASVQDGPEADAQRNSINTKYTEEQAKRVGQVLQDQAAVAGESLGGALRRANALWVQDSQDAAKQVAEIYNSLLGGINAHIAHAVTEIGERGQHNIARQLKNSVAGTVRGVGGSLVENGLKRAEAGILGAGKADGSKQSPFSVFVVNQQGKIGDVMPPGTTTAASNLVAGSSIGGSAVNIAKSALSFLPGGSLLSGLFGGGRAIGGDVKSGTTYLVGEHGPELFSPSRTGYISTSDRTKSMLGSAGDVHFGYIDARGATDPAAVRAQVVQGIREAAPHIIAASRASQRDERLRTPRGGGL